MIFTINDASPTGDWLDTMTINGDFAAHAVITGTATLAVEVSNNYNNLTTKSDAYTLEQFTGSFAKSWQRPYPRLWRFKRTTGTGSFVVSIPPLDGIGTDGKKIEIKKEPPASTGPSSELTPS